MYNRRPQNSVKQLSFNLKKVAKKEGNELKEKKTKQKGEEKDPGEPVDIGMRICCRSITYDSQVSDQGTEYY